MWVITFIFVIFAVLILNHYIDKKSRVALLSLFFALLEFTGSVFFSSLTVEDFRLETILNIFDASDPISIILGSGFVAFIIVWLICLFIWLIEKYQQQISEIGKSKRMFKAIILLSAMFSFIGFLAIGSARWVSTNFGGVGLQEIMYTISQPIQGTDTSQVFSYIISPLNNAIFFSLSFILVMVLLIIRFYPLHSRLDRKRLYFGIVHSIPIIVSVIFLVGGLTLGIGEFGYSEVKAYFFEKSTLFEDEYVAPDKVALTFPEEKRNLIYIFVESFESSYTSKELGGTLSENLLPELTSMIESGEAINFSATDSIGGALASPGTGFTVGGMVAQTSGIPLTVADGLNENDYGNTSSYLPGAYSVGEILATAGYNQAILMGSDAGFAGRDKYFSSHGNYEIRDIFYTEDRGWLPKGYRKWWGFEDEKLYDFAKKSLTELSEEPGPFNFTMLTADTHFPEGLVTDNTPEIYDNQYHNVIHYTDHQLSEFIHWIKEQPYYDNTTIILSGDHLTMDTGFAAEVPEGYTRSIFNMIINPVNEVTNTKNRIFTTMDMFPTTLGALGVEIDGDRLGLGTNMFSKKKTIPEEMGYDEFCNDLLKRSAYYSKYILKGTDMGVVIPDESE